MPKTLRNSLGPLFLILVCPTSVMLLWFTNTVLDGSFLKLYDLMVDQGVILTIYKIWKPYFFGTTVAWEIIFTYLLVEIAFMRILPGKTILGPVTPKGNTPVYKTNGLLAFIITISLFCIGSFGFGLFPATILYDNLGSLFGALNIFSLVVCLLLYMKGRFAPSSSDASTTKNFVFDYYWGTELHPKVFGLYIKKFITCHFGMMSWGVLLISYAAKQAETTGISNSMLISVALQLFYITKFFIWESGYLRSLDIMHDRAGFYICWGTLVWVPCVYTSPSMYLVLHPIHLDFFWAVLIMSCGIISISINYLADRQRQLTRLTGGNCKIWGKKPTTLLAQYETENGETKQSILLTSGWWGVTRHFHYIPEILGTFFWSVPALFENFSPYFYVTFLTVLLYDRAYRDEQRCAKKYGKYWDKYKAIVPYKIVPYIL